MFPNHHAEVAGDGGVPGADHGPRLGRGARPVAAPVRDRGGGLRARDPGGEADGARGHRIRPLGPHIRRPQTPPRTMAAPRWISPPIEAPHRFDLVGVAREMRAVEIRVRDDGGHWSNWVEQEDGTPIYVGGADIAQVRAPFRPRGRLHFVNVSGTAGSFADRFVNSARHAINAAVISVASTPVAQALAPKPQVVSRAAWGADLPSGGCPPRGPPEYGTVQAAVIHHTVNANDYTRGGGPFDRPRHLPVPRLRQRLERHRLQRPRRPLRDALRGARRRAQAPGRRGAGSGLQRTDDLDRLDRRPHQRGTHAAGAAIDHPVPRLEDGP